MRHFGFLVKDVSRLYSRNFERHSGAMGLTLMQCRVLVHLHRNEGISQVRLADLCDCEPMTLGRVITRLEDDGLINRRADPADGRARQLYLTPRAAVLIDDILNRAEQSRLDAMAGLSAAERTQLLQLLQRMHANLAALMPGLADVVQDDAPEPMPPRPPKRHTLTGKPT